MTMVKLDVAAVEPPRIGKAFGGVADGLESSRCGPRGRIRAAPDVHALRLVQRYSSASGASVETSLLCVDRSVPSAMPRTCQERCSNSRDGVTSRCTFRLLERKRYPPRIVLARSAEGPGRIRTAVRATHGWSERDHLLTSLDCW